MLSARLSLGLIPRGAVGVTFALVAVVIIFVFVFVFLVLDPVVVGPIGRPDLRPFERLQPKRPSAWSLVQEPSCGSRGDGRPGVLADRPVSRSDLGRV